MSLVTDQIYLITFTGLQKDDAVTTNTWYLSDRAFTTSDSDTPANQWFDPRVNTIPELRQELFSGTRLGGSSTSGNYRIKIANADGEFDNIEATYAFDGREIEIMRGNDGDAFSSFVTVFKGRILETIVNGDFMELSVSDQKRKLALPASNRFYRGMPIGLRFDGSTTRVDLPTTNLPGNARPFTVEFWFRKKSTSNRGTFFSYGESTGTDPIVQCLMNGDFTLSVFLIFAPASFLNVVSTPATMNVRDGCWHHFGLSWGSNLITLYIDGEEVDSFSGSVSSTIASNNEAFTIGALLSSGAYSDYWAGDMQEFRVWSKARTGPEIRADFDTPIDREDIRLKAYLPFSEGMDLIDGVHANLLDDDEIDPSEFEDIVLYDHAGRQWCDVNGTGHTWFIAGQGNTGQAGSQALLPIGPVSHYEPDISDEPSQSYALSLEPVAGLYSVRDGGLPLWGRDRWDLLGGGSGGGSKNYATFAWDASWDFDQTGGDERTFAISFVGDNGPSTTDKYLFDIDDGTNRMSMFWRNAGSKTIVFGRTISSGTQSYISPVTPELDKQYWIVVTLNDNNDATIYIGGKKVGSLSGDGGRNFDFSTAGTTFYVGRFNGANVGHWDGQILEFRAYDRILEPDEILDLGREQQDEELENELVMYIPFDEGTGSTVEEKIAGVNGTIAGTASWLSPQYTVSDEGAQIHLSRIPAERLTVELDRQRGGWMPLGTGTRNSGAFRLEWPDDVEWNMSASEEITVEFWGRLNDDATSFPISKKDAALASATSGWHLRMSPTQDVEVGVGDGVSNFQVVSTPAEYLAATGLVFNHRDWNHYAFVVSPVDDKLLLYINGYLIDSTVATGLGAVSNTDTLTLFARGALGSQTWNGDLCEVRIWNYERTQEELRKYMWKRLDIYRDRGVDDGATASENLVFLWPGGEKTDIGNNTPYQIAADGTQAGTVINNYADSKTVNGPIPRTLEEQVVALMNRVGLSGLEEIAEIREASDTIGDPLAQLVREETVTQAFDRMVQPNAIWRTDQENKLDFKFFQPIEETYAQKIDLDSMIMSTYTEIEFASFPWTISFWLFIDDNLPDTSSILKVSSGSPSWLQVQINSDSLEIIQGSIAASPVDGFRHVYTFSSSDSSIAPQPGWNHYAITVNGDPNQDGVNPITTSSNEPTVVRNNGTPFTMPNATGTVTFAAAKTNDWTYDWRDGALIELAAWDTDYLSIPLADLQTGTPDPGESGLQLYCPFNDRPVKNLILENLATNPTSPNNFTEDISPTTQPISERILLTDTGFLKDTDWEIGRSQISKIRRRKSIIPTSLERVGFRQNYAPMSRDELVPSARSQFDLVRRFRDEFKWRRKRSVEVEDVHELAQPGPDIASALVEGPDARSAVQTAQRNYSVRRSLYDVETPDQSFTTVKVGDTINVKHDRLEFTGAGKNMYIVGRTFRRGLVRLICWG